MTRDATRGERRGALFAFFCHRWWEEGTDRRFPAAAERREPRNNDNQHLAPPHTSPLSSSSPPLAQLGPARGTRCFAGLDTGKKGRSSEE